MKRKIVFAALFALVTLCLSCSSTGPQGAAKSEGDEQRIIAQNEVAASGMVRHLTASQISYETTFPKQGFAADLARLGPGTPPVDCAKQEKPDSAHGCFLLDNDPGCSSQWCVKQGYKYGLVSTCAPKAPCSDFAIVATPVSIHTGQKSVCATSDGIIRWRIVGPLTSPISVRECNTWSPI